MRLIPFMLNNNMRCFEMCDDADVYVVDVPLNNNMRCFEIKIKGQTTLNMSC